MSEPTPAPGTPPPTVRLPRWLSIANRVIGLLQRLGIAFFSFHMLSVPGRKSGRLRTTPVSPFVLAEQQYIVSFGQTEWVKNARVAGWGILARGRRRQRVHLIELGLDERTPILREFPLRVPQGVRFLVQAGAVQPPGDPAALEAAALGLAVFRIEPS
jgi:hypothetical protein